MSSDDHNNYCRVKGCGKSHDRDFNCWFLMWQAQDMVNGTKYMCIAPWNQELAKSPTTIAACGQNHVSILMASMLAELQESKRLEHTNE